MPYVRDIAREAVAQLGLDSGFELAAQFVSQSYQELCAQSSFRHLRKLGALYLPAPLNTGTFTITLGSPVIVADATASQAMATSPGAPQSLHSQWFRLQQGAVWYKILRADPTNPGAWTLTLTTPFAADNNAQGIFPNPGEGTSGPINYYIIQRFIDLDPSARTIGTVVVDAVYRPLRQISEDEMNLAYSSRVLVSFPPWFFSILGQDDEASGLPKSIEIYPWPVNSTTLHYTYWKHPPTLDLDAFVPPTIDPDVLRTGAKSLLCLNQAGKSRRAGNLDIAQAWRNDALVQQTEFNSKVSRAVRNDRGGDDVKFLLSRSAWNRPTMAPDYDPIQTAYENFLSRGI